jgi:predicted nucleic acid-binding protein
MKRLLLDTGVLYALFDHRDAYHSQVTGKAPLLDTHRILLPWPVVYETLKTRFVAKATAVAAFQSLLRRPNVDRVDDTQYREDALELAMSSALKRKRPLSLVDCMLRLMLSDVNIRVDGFSTFNSRDFADVCRKRQIEML